MTVIKIFAAGCDQDGTVVSLKDTVMFAEQAIPLALSWSDGSVATYMVPLRRFFTHRPWRDGDAVRYEAATVTDTDFERATAWARRDNAAHCDWCLGAIDHPGVDCPTRPIT